MFIKALQSGPPLLLDGAIGTELAARGFDTDRPGWTALATHEAPDLLQAIHQDYVDAGADVITSNTFRTHASSVASLNADAAELTREAVSIARAVSPRFVFGSSGPLGDCYSPNQTPSTDTLISEHSRHAELLADSGVDAILFETIPTAREAHAVASVAAALDRPAAVSLWSADGHNLGDNATIRQTAQALVDTGIELILVNCFPAVDPLPADPFWGDCEFHWGAYGNAGRLVDGRWHDTAASDPEIYATHAARWMDDGARVLGGCCGTNPSHIRALRSLIDSREGDRSSPDSLTPEERTP